MFSNDSHIVFLNRLLIHNYMPSETSAEAQQKNYEAANSENQRAEQSGKDGTAGRNGMTAKNNDKIDSLESNPDQLTTNKFAVKGSEVTVKETEEDLIVENIPVQALGKDRDGDKITSEGQKKVVEQLKSGNVPAFPNHGIGEYDAIYDFRDIMGQWVDGKHEDGMTFGTLRLRKGNDAAKHLKDLLEQDMPVGFSVGFIPKDFDQNESQDMNGEAISDLDLMEISPVGIPSKPEAVNELENEPVAMAKSIMKENEGGSTAEGFSKEFTKRLKNAMSQKDGTEKQDEQSEGKSEGQEKEQDIKQLSEDDVNTITDTLEQHMTAALNEIEEELSGDSEDDEETDEADEGEEDEDEEQDSVEQDSQDSQEDKETGEEEKDGSDQTEDSEKSESSESEEKDNDPESEEKESGLSDEEKTLDESDEKNTIDTIDEEKDQKESSESENQEEKGGELDDPFVITPDSKA